MQARQQSRSITSLSTLLDPTQFKVVVAAVIATCGFDDNSNEFAVPSLGLKLGHSLKKCASIMKCEALQNDDQVSVQRANSFIELCDIEWLSCVSSHALRTLQQRQWNNPKRLPLATDVKKLKEHLNSKADFNKCRPKTSPDDTQAWNELPKCTLVIVMLFNRRRSGEIERILLTSYDNTVNGISSDATECLSEWEQALCRNLKHVEIRGKRGRKVPVLLTETMHEYITVLTETRTAVGVCVGVSFCMPFQWLSQSFERCTVLA